MPTVVPNTERKAKAVRPNSKTTSLSSSIEARAAILHRHGQAEEAQLPHFRDDLLGNGVFGLDTVFIRNQSLVDKPPHRVEQDAGTIIAASEASR